MWEFPQQQKDTDFTSGNRTTLNNFYILYRERERDKERTITTGMIPGM